MQKIQYFRFIYYVILITILSNPLWSYTASIKIRNSSSNQKIQATIYTDSNTLTSALKPNETQTIDTGTACPKHIEILYEGKVVMAWNLTCGNSEWTITSQSSLFGPHIDITAGIHY